MTFGELLRTKKDAIVQRWLEEVFASYPEDSAAAFRRQKDPFANPVGCSLRVGTQGILEALVEGQDAEKTCRYLHEIIKIRAVQQFTPSQAVGFVFGLKDAIRAELGKEVKDAALAAELADLEGRIDRIALAAFDVFVQCREQVCELRIAEVKRQVSWVMGKIGQRDLDREATRVDLE
jgi:hypothetical protein